MAKRTNLQQITDAAGYDTLAKLNPALLEAVKTVIEQGGTASQLESRLRRVYGRNGGLVVDCAIGAAYHLEGQDDAN